MQMPTGTGKTITLLSLITSYQLAHPEVGKLVYCTRTVPEMEKVLAELHELITYRARYTGGSSALPILALGLSSRKNLCCHPTISEEGSREGVDAACRRLTASWTRERAVSDPNIELCEFFEGHERAGTEALLPPGVYTLADMRAYGRKKGWCPYFLARHMMAFANVVVYNYQYMIDPKVSQMVSRELEKECVVVFDEAHNIDNVCIESLSVNLRLQTLDSASRNLTRLDTGLVSQGTLPDPGQVGGEEWLAHPALPEDVLRETVPGNIRRAEHFITFMRRLITYMRERLGGARQVVLEEPIAFLTSLQSNVAVDAKTLKFCYDRLTSLMKTLEISNTEEFTPISIVADFATLVGTYARGFAVITEPFDSRTPNIPDPVIQLSCLDASLAMRPVFSKFQSVIITSGTLSPIELYPRILNFNPVSIQSFSMTLPRDCICPVVLTRGADQMPMSTKFEMRADSGVVRNYGRTLVELAAVVPDGLVCFFVSYLYMDSIISKWHDMGILQEIMNHKLVFIETQDVVETTLALDNFRRACDSGRGAVFMSVARGKVAEGIDFDRHYGRCVVMFGVPYQYTLSRVLRSRLDYLRDTFHIKEDDYLAFDAVRQAAQCVGRVIRSKSDYGMMVFADKRYQRSDKRDKLPNWITRHLRDGHLNLSTDMLLTVTREFMRNMAQPFDQASVGRSLLSEAQLNALHQASMAQPAAWGTLQS
ncbi:DNA repair helicase [Dunaliella salina]|uniref:DNA 5'-3' helicase n=1 Tax=Dunaliella salina TaxID=3046 RepID=A0ABQ7H845_DUNSA|nr:DNA repair helicase [Dunaliella salina]|eukprot:KAF5843023.1 DNA repair helicase [Dunaliella salina]